MSSDDWFSSFLKYTVNAIGLNDFFNSATVSDRDPSEATKEVKTTNDSIAKAKEVADAIKKALDEEKKEAADAKLEEIQAWLSINTLEPNRIPPPLHEIKNTDNVIERWNDIKRLNQTNYRYTYEMKAYDENCMAIDPHESPEKVSYYKTEIYRVANNQYTNFGTIYSSPNHDGMIFHESYNKENGRNYILQNTVSNDIASRNFAREISNSNAIAKDLGSRLNTSKLNLPASLPESTIGKIKEKMGRGVERYHSNQNKSPNSTIHPTRRTNPANHSSTSNSSLSPDAIRRESWKKYEMEQKIKKRSLRKESERTDERKEKISKIIKLEVDNFTNKILQYKDSDMFLKAFKENDYKFMRSSNFDKTLWNEYVTFRRKIDFIIDCDKNGVPIEDIKQNLAQRWLAEIQNVSIDRKIRDRRNEELQKEKEQRIEAGVNKHTPFLSPSDRIPDFYNLALNEVISLYEEKGYTHDKAKSLAGRLDLTDHINDQIDKYITKILKSNLSGKKSQHCR